MAKSAVPPVRRFCHPLQNPLCVNVGTWLVWGPCYPPAQPRSAAWPGRSAKAKAKGKAKGKSGEATGKSIKAKGKRKAAHFGRGKDSDVVRSLRALRPSRPMVRDEAKQQVLGSRP